MKKSVAILLTVIGGLPAVFGISALNFLLFFCLFPFGVLAAIALTAGAAFGIDGLRVLFAKKYGISAPKFLLCAYAPSIAASAVYFTVVSGYFKGYFAGMSEFIFKLAWLISSTAAAVLGVIMLIITSYIKPRKGKCYMKRFAIILLILALIVGCLGICMICLPSVRAPEDTEGWGALAQSGVGIILVGLALLLAASGAAIFIDRLCLSKKRKGNNKNEH